MSGFSAADTVYHKFPGVQKRFKLAFQMVAGLQSNGTNITKPLLFCCKLSSEARCRMGETSVGEAPWRADLDQKEEIRAYLDQLLASSAFTASRRRSQLLRYLVERALAVPAEPVTEYGIGLDVFRKPESFDPRVDATVRVEMSRLRRVLLAYYQGPGIADPWRLELPGRGYVPVIKWNGPPPVDRPDGFVDARPNWRGLGWCFVALLLVFSATVMLRRYAGSWHSSVSSVVVLPFENLTGDSKNEYLADGITEQLTDSLAHAPDLRVVARTSAFQFKRKGMDIRQIGKQLDADAVVEGSLRNANGHYQLTVQVDRSRDGYHIRSQTLEGGTQELARLEAEMTPIVLTALRPGGEQGPVRKPIDPEAYNLFLQARALRGDPSQDAFDRSVTLLNKAVELDPTYADAYAALAGVYGAEATDVASEPKPYAEKAIAAADMALRLDPQSAPAYAAKGMVDSLVFLSWRRGEDELRKALGLMPQNASIHNRLGVVLMAEGRFEEAIAEERTTVKLDPLATAGATLGLAYYMARQYDQALHEFLQVRDLHPGIAVIHTFIGSAWEGKGDYQKAMQEYQLALPKVPGAKAYIAHLLAVTGKEDEARKLAAELERPESGEAPNGFDLACVYGALGERDRAFYWLGQASKNSELWFVKVHPMLDPLRRDPRFAQFLRKAGFPS